ncbi:oleoyl-acyl carrier protein thioesterase 2, chloroplastic isoform X2 [Capsella rubella]|uniref:oleoyl-acyl carrier protein thioesterase 2, chloroplastic isoform X2 n=1 Tax=Capsella rubella TaxID=81985 RepID=UPI000CD59EAE|nr:oleoyl-acyl carrier protein thioesterase 2, chloroplastic isoform X2 [Capsella rubella]
MLKLSCNVTDHLHSFFSDPRRVFVPVHRRTFTEKPISCFQLKKEPLRAILSADQGNSSSLRVADSVSDAPPADRLRFGRLMEDGFSYKEKFIVRSYEVGINKTATVETIANLLQEVACNHVQKVGFSTDGFATTLTMRKLHLIWVTARMHIEIYKYPACKWVMMNQDTRRLQRVTDEVRDEYLVFCPREPRLAFPEENNSSLKKIPKLEDPAQYSMLGLKPRRADLDMNQHVNNVTYIGWVLESIPQEIIDTHELKVITLDYRRECQQDDIVDSLTTSETPNEAVSKLTGTNGSTTSSKQEHNESQFLHILRLSENGQEINRGRTQWRKKSSR